jgi:hypothetical protein
VRRLGEGRSGDRFVGYASTRTTALTRQHRRSVQRVGSVDTTVTRKSFARPRRVSERYGIASGLPATRVPPARTCVIAAARSQSGGSALWDRRSIPVPHRDIDLREIAHLLAWRGLAQLAPDEIASPKLAHYGTGAGQAELSSTLRKNARLSMAKSKGWTMVTVPSSSGSAPSIWN